MRTTVSRLGLMTLFAGLLSFGALTAAAPAPNKPGELKVEDEAGLFGKDAVRKAKDDFAVWVSSKSGRQVSFHTVAKLPDADKAKLDQLKDAPAKSQFWSTFARTHAKDDHAKGVYVFISRSPGHVEVVADDEMRNKGFSRDKAVELRDLLVKGLGAAVSKTTPAEQQTARDETLKSAVKYLEDHLPAASKDVVPGKANQTGNANAPAHEEKKGWGIGSYLCAGIAIIAVIWVLFAVVRGLTGMMGGGGGGPGGGGYGSPGMGGGGGMGFLGTFMTGMFGAAAGMWMYNSFMGGSSAFGGDAGTGAAGAGGGESVDNAGAGDFNSDGAGGDYGGGGDAGGGDWGGGGGDAGGGDFGGGDF